VDRKAVFLCVYLDTFRVKFATLCSSSTWNAIFRRTSTIKHLTSVSAFDTFLIVRK
jgi:hypothetical protein